MCITAFLIYHLWQIIFKNNDELKRIGWLPILLWITIPSCSWSYINNMMENSMGIFTLGAIICIFKSFESQKHKFGLLILSGFLVFLATLSKGVPGLFPLSVPFLHWLIIRNKSVKNAFLLTLVILVIPAVFYFILFSFPQSRESLKFYFTERLLRRINENPTVGSRFYIIERLFMELIPLIILVIVIIVYSRIKKLNIQFTSYFKYSLLFLSIGLTASVPMILTLIQRGFYLVPSFPYFAIGFSTILVPLILLTRENLSNNPKKNRILLNMSAIVFVLSIAFVATQKGKTERDKDMLHDVYAIGKEIPKNSAVTITQDLASVYVLECYFIRYFNIGLFVNQQKEYYLTRKTSDFSNEAFEKLKIDTRLYDMYKRK
jgi:fluoride ion exporter CrcB/FEX